MKRQAMGFDQRAQRDKVLQRLAGPLRGQAKVNLAQAYSMGRA
jgi:hypothetical protein